MGTRSPRKPPCPSGRHSHGCSELVPQHFPHPSTTKGNPAPQLLLHPLLIPSTRSWSLLSHDPEIFAILTAPPSPANYQLCKLPPKISSVRQLPPPLFRASASPSPLPMQPSHLSSSCVRTHPPQPCPIRKGLCGNHSLRDPAGCGPSPFPPARSAYAPSCCPFPGCNYEHLKSGDIFLQPPSKTRNSVAFSTLSYFIYNTVTIQRAIISFVGFMSLALLWNKHSMKANEPQSRTGNGSCPAGVEQLAVHLHLYWVVDNSEFPLV